VFSSSSSYSFGEALRLEAFGLSRFHSPVQMLPAVVSRRGNLQGSSGVPWSGVTQEVLCPFLEGEQEQSEDDCLEADCAASFIHYEP
jgi:hypothetical protein